MIKSEFMAVLAILMNWDEIVGYMDYEIREKVHFELSPCTKYEFLMRYLELDPSFRKLMWDVFRIEVDDLEV